VAAGACFVVVAVASPELDLAVQRVVIAMKIRSVLASINTVLDQGMFVCFFKKKRSREAYHVCRRGYSSVLLLRLSFAFIFHAVNTAQYSSKEQNETRASIFK